ncbi:adenylyltransferase/cytidyltransferase family protein [Gordonia asplenii]|uniref:adenylyltransferase/cytidyltransferase family protein n=1 Tax=Gordonia asplenii TaxID=2725283 RepID=UPI0028A6B183|nr:adenylyltransferase/cytidyltransferase family protein [Gordonia asplenii]
MRRGTLVATGGCFDLLHPGHLSLLQRARALGDSLVVCLNSDASVARAKGAERPVMPAADRAQLLKALDCVDDVVIFDEDTPTKAIERLRPDIWVKGSDYAEAGMPETPTVRACGGRVMILSTIAGYSSTNLIKAAKPAGGDGTRRIFGRNHSGAHDRPGSPRTSISPSIQRPSARTEQESS